ncbi:hypothetical protein [Cupriavidus pauculus]|uniref:hypothetical protein n=2 Tax=Cupriavidus pauculus TaxID=82633 RepID=UPI000781F8A9|nr:hypothetical protein [Cupriavidus pauculus]KAB0594462.1 hypothetical protein F7R19_29365 [Cupriavidus pauculus]MBY4733139.1 hypothetical protein [Cupriavidus pauculus]MCM3607571.1 hypothetical protein [Cupriavidus pauculus]UAL01758.1 hypothetical protein K8O84_23230 [Cupriavidus pauculus]
MRSHRVAVAALSTAFLAWPFVPASAGPQLAEASATAVAVASSDTGAAAAVAGAAASVSAMSADAGRKPNIFGMTAKAVGADKLDDVRGGAELVVNDMRLHGTVADNAAINTLSGSNIVSEGSFANAAGLPTVIQNSGSNVLIQNATILNVQFK